MTHLGGIIQRGPGLSMVEATAVTAEGRITPEDSGLWKDSQMAPLRRIVEFAHSQGQNIAIQLAHAGRKASTVAPWLNRGSVATKEAGQLLSPNDNEEDHADKRQVNGWPDKVLAPSAVPYNERLVQPKEMSKDDIEEFKKAWVASVKRALACGFNAIEIHNAQYVKHSPFRMEVRSP